MEITATLDYGSLEVELSSDKREEVEQNLLEVVGFLEENDEIFDGLNRAVQGDYSQAELGKAKWTENDTHQEPSEDGSPLDKLERKLGVTTEFIDEIVYVDPDGEEQPQLMVDGDRLGGSVPERQRHAAFIILTVLKECYNEKEMQTSQFKDILAFAEISDSNLHRAWDDSLFEQSGMGGSAKVTLKGPGKREAKKFFKELAQSLSE